MYVFAQQITLRIYQKLKCRNQLKSFLVFCDLPTGIFHKEVETQ